jgi:hypothetical protein
MRCAIFYHHNNEKKARELFDSIKKDYKLMEYKYMVFAMSGRGGVPTVCFTNNKIYDRDTWAFISDEEQFNTSFHHFNIAYIDNDLSDKQKFKITTESINRLPFNYYNFF